MKLEMIILAFVGLGLFAIGMLSGAKIVDRQHDLRNEVTRQIHCEKKELT